MVIFLLFIVCLVTTV